MDEPREAIRVYLITIGMLSGLTGVGGGFLRPLHWSPKSASCSVCHGFAAAGECGFQANATGCCAKSQ